MKPLRASDTTSTRLERHISPAFVLGELRRDVLYLDVHLFSLAEHHEVTLPTPSRTPPHRSLQRSPATWPDLSGPPLAVILLPTASPCFTLARPQPLVGRRGFSSPV